jgi:hypothetical protein
MEGGASYLRFFNVSSLVSKWSSQLFSAVAAELIILEREAYHSRKKYNPKNH